MNLDWMAWTLPSALFFLTIFVILIGMAIWEIASPNMERRGFLPIATTRGDRLFIGLLTSAYIHLAWIGLTHFAIWIITIFAVMWMIVLMRWG